MDCIAPFAELLGKIVGCFASPCAWPLVYCFQADGDLGRPWDVQMEYAPCKQPHVCCCSMCCVWCMQFEVRRMVLDKDMSKYKLFQGYYDGPYGCARWKPSLPFTLTAGTYGDAGSPLFLALEVCLCPFCAFDVSREYQREDRALGYDPTEIRVDKCLEFFRCIAELCLCCGFCVACVGCCAGCCLGEKDVEQSSYRLGGACLNIAQGIIRGMRWVIRIATACMSAQMCHEHKLPKPDVQKPRIMGAPEQQSMGLNRFVQGPTGIPTPPPRPSPTPPPTANPATTPAPTPSPTPAGNPGYSPCQPPAARYGVPAAPRPNGPPSFGSPATYNSWGTPTAPVPGSPRPGQLSAPAPSWGTPQAPGNPGQFGSPGQLSAPAPSWGTQAPGNPGQLGAPAPSWAASPQGSPRQFHAPAPNWDTHAPGNPGQFGAPSPSWGTPQPGSNWQAGATAPSWGTGAVRPPASPRGHWGTGAQTQATAYEWPARSRV